MSAVRPDCRYAGDIVRFATGNVARWETLPDHRQHRRNVSVAANVGNFGKFGQRCFPAVNDNDIKKRVEDTMIFEIDPMSDKLALRPLCSSLPPFRCPLGRCAWQRRRKDLHEGSLFLPQLANRRPERMPKTFGHSFGFVR